jgi:hypothetical protein
MRIRRCGVLHLPRDVVVARTHKVCRVKKLVSLVRGFGGILCERTRCAISNRLLAKPVVYFFVPCRARMRIISNTLFQSKMYYLVRASVTSTKCCQTHFRSTPSFSVTSHNISNTLRCLLQKLTRIDEDCCCASSTRD